MIKMPKAPILRASVDKLRGKDKTVLPWEDMRMKHFEKIKEWHDDAKIVVADNDGDTQTTTLIYPPRKGKDRQPDEKTQAKILVFPKSKDR